MNYWLSVDPANLTGIATWRGDKLLSVGTLRATERKNKTEWKQYGAVLLLDTLRAGDVERRRMVFADEGAAWRTLLVGVVALIAEEGFGAHKTVIKQHAFRRGFMAALCSERCVAFHEVHVGEWRKVVGKANGFTFPNDSELSKARAMELVEARFGQRVSDDEADAACAGLWALETRTVRV